MADLLTSFEEEIASITLIPSDGGKFEVVVNDTLVYSKLATGRHMEDGEAVKLVTKFLKDGQR
jgi:selenoprotein W-related protein